MIILEVNFKWHLEAFVSELLISHKYKLNKHMIYFISLFILQQPL